MADSNKELIYKVKFEADEQSAQQVGKDLQQELDKGGKAEGGSKKRREATEQETSALKELRKTLKQYQEDLAEIQESSRMLGDTSRSNIQVQQSLGTAIAETRSQIEQATKGSLDYDNILKEQPRTYTELVQQNRALTLAMRQLPLDDTSGELEALQAQFRANNNELKTFDATLGNHQRNVGDYENSIRTAANALAVFQGPLGPIAGRINSIATVISRLSKRNTENAKTWGQMGLLSRAWNILTLRQTIPTITASANATRAKTMAIRGANAGILIFNGTLKLLRSALIATGIGAFAVALGSLIAFFSRTEEGAERLRVGLAGFRAMFDVLGDRLSVMGKRLLDAFTDPKQAVIDLWNAIKTNLLNRIQGIGDTFRALGRVISASLRLDFESAGEASREMANAFAQAITGIEDVVGKAGELVDKMKENRDLARGYEEEMNAVLRTERELGVERAQQNRDLQQARDLARDLTIDYDDRLAGLQAAREAEEKLMEREMANELERLRIIEDQMELSDDDAKAKQALADQQAKVFQMEQEHYQRSISLRRDETAIIRQRDEFILRSLRNQITEQERASNLAIRRVEREMRDSGRIVELALLERQAFEDRLEQETNARFLAYQQEFLNQRFSEEDAERMARKRAEEELALERIELDEQVADARLQRERSTAEAALQVRRVIAEREFAQDTEIARRKNDQIAIIEAERARLEVEIAQEQEMRIAQLAQQFRNQGLDEHQAMTNAKLIIDEQYATEAEALERRLADARFSVQQEMMNSYIALAKNTGQAIFGENKALAVSGAIMDTYSGATAALGMRPWTPLNYVNSAAVIAAGIANVRKILAVKKDTQTVTATSAQAVAPTQQFELIDTANFNAMTVAGEMGAQGAQPELTVVLEGEFDKEALAVKVREGNNALSSRGIILRTGS